MIASVDLTHPIYLRSFKGDAASPTSIKRRAYQHARYLFEKAAGLRRRIVFGPEDPIGPQDIPDGLAACSRCDMLTARPSGECGFCAAELLRAGRAA